MRLELSPEGIICLIQNKSLLSLINTLLPWGSVIEYTYTKTSDYLGNLEEWSFQEDIPIVWSEYNVKIPEWFHFEIVSQGSLMFTVNENKQINESTSGISWKATEYNWAIANAAPMDDEPYISTKRNYTSKINFQMISFTPPRGSVQKIGGNYKDFNKQLLADNNFGKLLNRRAFLSETVAEITNGMNDDGEKALAIYSFVRNEMTFNDKYGIYPNNLRKAWKERKGSVPQINFLLIMMLLEANLEASPLISSTRQNGYLHPIYLNKERINYLTCQLDTEKGPVLLDASNKGYPFGILHPRTLNFQGWVVSESNSGWVNMKGRTKAESTTQVNLELNENGTLNGLLTEKTKGYSDINKRNAIYKKGEDQYNEELNEKMLFWSVDSLNIKNKDNAYQSLITECQISNEENEDSDIIYLTPVITGKFENNPFDADERIMPIDFSYGSKDNYVMSISIPEGYEVAETPASTALKLPNNTMSYQFSSTQIGNKISIVSTFKINHLFYNADQYQNIKKFFELMIEKQNEQIVIKKI